jgi:signal transduction histidine kinase
MADAAALICNVNDRDAARYVITRMLERAGFRVVEAATGGEALELARRERPAAMVLDLRLPDIDGMEVCRRLKADGDTASIAVLQTSATFVSTEAKVHGLEDGADAFLLQPFTAQELIATIRSLLRLQGRETAQLRRAEALAEADRRKDEFLAMLAHELRNPLAAVTTALAILDRHPPHDAPEARARDIARRQTAQLARIVDDLLDVSRVMRGIITLHRERIDLARLLGQATALAEDTRLRGRDRRIVLDAAVPVHVDGDRVRLMQVLSNLLDNAIKYTVAGGRIDVSLARDGDDAVVRVRDDGVGIARPALASVFDLFFQSQASIHRSSGGLGIGLTLVRALTEQHGGRVVARSEGEGHGAEFEVRLPAVAAPDDALAAVAPVARRPRAGRPTRVLIVEDNVDAREVLGDLCNLWGHDVRVACDGLAGLEEALARPPDVALVDIGLPGLDGYEVARRLRADPRGARVHLVALTGYGSAEQRAQASAAGFDAHLVKPADADALAAVIAAARPDAP